jgi:flagellin-like protein
MMEKLKATFDADDRAVSPVIGVILMVAITVVLAAVIGTMVLGMGDSVQSNVQAGANVEWDQGNDDGTVTVTWNNNQNADHLAVQFKHSNGTAVGSNDYATNPSGNLTNVGDSITLSEDGKVGDSNIKVIVTAYGADGASTVVAEESDVI